MKLGLVAQSFAEELRSGEEGLGLPFSEGS